MLYHPSVHLPESHKSKWLMPGNDLLRRRGYGVIARRCGRSAGLIVLTSLLCASLCVLADGTGSDDLRKAIAQVTEIEPLAAPIFTHTQGASLVGHGVTREITVGYKVSAAARTSPEALRANITKLFHATGWLDGMPPGVSASETNNRGVVTQPLAFRASSDLQKAHSIFHAYMWIADALSSVRCTYVFRDTE